MFGDGYSRHVQPMYAYFWYFKTARAQLLRTQTWDFVNIHLVELSKIFQYF